MNVDAMQILHDNVRHILLFSQFMNGYDVGMMEFTGRASFTIKAFPQNGILQCFGSHCLESHFSIQHWIIGFVYHAHSAFPNNFQEVIFSDFRGHHSGKYTKVNGENGFCRREKNFLAICWTGRLAHHSGVVIELSLS